MTKLSNCSFFSSIVWHPTGCYFTVDQRLHDVLDLQLIARSHILVVARRLDLHELKLRVDAGERGLDKGQDDQSREKSGLEQLHQVREKGPKDRDRIERIVWEETRKKSGTKKREKEEKR